MHTQPASFEAYHTLIYMDQLLDDCIKRKISDLHFEPFSHEFRLRVRLEGRLETHQAFSSDIYQMIAQRFKALAHLHITEQRIPQDGQWLWQHQQIPLSVPCRLSTCPVLYGEKLVVRLLQHPLINASWTDLGMTEIQGQVLEKHLQYQQGLILVNGPTGSGKTTTLYQALHHIHHAQLNIISVEDPIEIPFPSINQVEILPSLGFSIPQTLRSILRQDPDVILIGEIRDTETAKLAFQAAQTGHLVLSSLHSSDCQTSIQRLQNLGISSADIHAHLHLIIAQKLIPKITGGRIGVFEFLELNGNYFNFQEQLFTLYEQGIIAYESLAHD